MLVSQDDADECTQQTWDVDSSVRGDDMVDDESNNSKGSASDENEGTSEEEELKDDRSA